MAKGYMIVNLEVHDPDMFAEYAAKVPPIIEQYGGRYLVRGGTQEVIEGDTPRPRSVVLEFPSVEQAKTWYNSPEYQAILPKRLNASNANALLVEGV